MDTLAGVRAPMSETDREARYDGWLDAVARVRSQDPLIPPLRN